MLYICTINSTTLGKQKPLVKNTLSFPFPPSAFSLASLLTATRTQTVLHEDTSLYSNTYARANTHTQCCTLNREQRGHFSLYGWEMERTLWFCCSVALFSSPHLFKAVRQQSGAINLNRSALPALLWLDVMISGCHSTHWYVSLCDPSASLFCHEQSGVYHGHTGGILPRSIHSTLPHNPCYQHVSSPSLCDIWMSHVKKHTFLFQGILVKRFHPASLCQLLMKAVTCWPLQKIT